MTDWLPLLFLDGRSGIRGGDNEKSQFPRRGRHLLRAGVVLKRQPHVIRIGSTRLLVQVAQVGHAEGAVLWVDRGEVVKAFIIPNREPTEELKRDVQEFVKTRLSKHEYPREIEFVSELPKTPDGKIQRKKLKEYERAKKLAKMC